MPSATSSPRPPVLRKGSRIAYPGLGPARVTEMRERPDGTRVAVLDLPHQQMTIDLPTTNTAITERLRPLMSQKDARRLITLPDADGREPLATSWVGRRDRVHRAVAAEDPAEWVAVVRAYIDFIRGGGAYTASDHDIVGQALDQLAAEAAVVLNRPFLALSERLQEEFRHQAGPFALAS